MTEKCLGQWNAWVASGTTTEDKHARLAEAPIELHERIKSHVNTVARLRNKALKRK